MIDTMTDGLRVGRALFDVLLGPATEAVSDQLSSMRSRVVTMTGGECCRVPDPCWMPKRLPPVRSHACAGATVRVRIRVTNEGIQSRAISAAAPGKAGAGVSFAPASLTLGPLESDRLTATVKVPDDPDTTEPLRVNLWIRGCHDHVIPWEISVSRHGCDCLHEIEISDGPDLVHHWYDHFYCQHPCPGGRVKLDD
jgi:hypothetical protein